MIGMFQKWWPLSGWGGRGEGKWDGGSAWRMGDKTGMRERERERGNANICKWGEKQFREREREREREKRRLVTQNMQMRGGVDDVSDPAAPPAKQKVAHLITRSPPPRFRPVSAPSNRHAIWHGKWCGLEADLQVDLQVDLQIRLGN